MRFQNAGLLAGNLAPRMTQKVFVVEIDARDDGDGRLQGVGRIESSAKPDFKHAEIDVFLRKIFHSHGRYAFKVSRMRAQLALGKQFFDQALNPREY